MFRRLSKPLVLFTLAAAMLIALPCTAFADEETGELPELRGTIEFRGLYHPGSELTAVVTLDDSCKDASLLYHWAVADNREFTENTSSIVGIIEPSLEIPLVFEHRYLRVTADAYGYSGTLSATTYEIIHVYWLGKPLYNETECWRKCRYCDKTAEKQPHSFGETTVNVPATCTESGQGTAVCSRCSYEKTVEIPATGHVPAAVWSFDGASHWKACSNCGAPLESAAHEFGEWTTAGEATASSTDSRKRSCSICGYTETETVEPPSSGQDAPSSGQGIPSTTTAESTPPAGAGAEGTMPATADGSAPIAFGAILAAVSSGVVAVRCAVAGRRPYSG